MSIYLERGLTMIDLSKPANMVKIKVINDDGMYAETELCIPVPGSDMEFLKAALKHGNPAMVEILKQAEEQGDIFICGEYYDYCEVQHIFEAHSATI